MINIKNRDFCEIFLFNGPYSLLSLYFSSYFTYDCEVEKV